MGDVECGKELRDGHPRVAAGKEWPRRVGAMRFLRDPHQFSDDPTTYEYEALRRAVLQRRRDEFFFHDVSRAFFTWR